MLLLFWSPRNRANALLALSLVLVTQASSRSSQSDPLIGLWGGNVRSTQPVEGQLTLDEREGVWRASIAGYQLPVKAGEEKLEFVLPGGRGEFRRRVDRGANIVEGQWIQAATEILNPQYASPLELYSVAPHVWRGIVRPLDFGISVYASITLGSNGKLEAFFENPEANFFRGRTFTLKRDGTRVHLEANGWKIEGSYDEKSDELSFQFVDSLPSFKLSRRKDRDAVGFYARVPADDSPYGYRPPVTSNDGWRTASLSDEGLDEKPLASLINQILSSNPPAERIPIQSLLIARHGRLVLEEYFYGFSEDRVHDMRSASKTFAPVLVGLATLHGVNLTPQTRIYSLFTRYKTFENWDARKQTITLRDIMTMTAGNACDDNDDDSPGNEDRNAGRSQNRRLVPVHPRSAYAEPARRPTCRLLLWRPELGGRRCGCLYRCLAPRPFQRISCETAPVRGATT
jgi:hypothetical protein